MSSGAATPSVCSSIISANSGASTCSSTKVATTDMPTSYFSSKTGDISLIYTKSANAQPTSIQEGGDVTSTVCMTTTSTKPCPAPPTPVTSSANAIPTTSSSSSDGPHPCTCENEHTSSVNAIPTTSCTTSGFEGALPPRQILHGYKKRTGDQCTCPPPSSSATTTSQAPCICSTSSVNAVPTSTGGKSNYEGALPPRSAEWDYTLGKRTGDGKCECQTRSANAVPTSTGGFEGNTPPQMHEAGRREWSELSRFEAEKIGGLPPPDFHPDNRKRAVLTSAPALQQRNTPAVKSTHTVTSTKTVTKDDCSKSSVNSQPTTLAEDDYEDCDEDEEHSKTSSVNAVPTSTGDREGENSLHHLKSPCADQQGRYLPER